MSVSTASELSRWVDALQSASSFPQSKKGSSDALPKATTNTGTFTSPPPGQAGIERPNAQKLDAALRLLQDTELKHNQLIESLSRMQAEIVEHKSQSDLLARQSRKVRASAEGLLTSIERTYADVARSVLREVKSAAIHR